MDAVWAEEALRAFVYLTPDQVKALTLLATGDEAAAARAFARKALDEMRGR